MNRKVHPDAIEQSLPGGAVANAEGALLWEQSEGQITNAGTILIGLLLFWLVLPLILTLWRIWQTSRHTYALSSQRLREREGVFVRHIEELELYRVKDIAVHQPFLQRLFGRGQVVLSTSDRSTPIVILNAVPNPLGVADLIRHHVEACRVAKGVREID